MKSILIIGHLWPEPSTTAAGCRMLQLIEAFRGFGYKVVFGSSASKTDYSLDLKTLDVESIDLQLNHASFDEFVKKLDPKLVVFDRFMTEEQFGWRVGEHAPNAIRILNTEDLHSLRKAREERYRNGQKFTLNNWKEHPMTLRELSSIYRSDISLMVSSFEINLLTQEAGIPENLLLHLPFMLDVPSEREIKNFPNFEERKDFICVGNGKHPPNIAAIKTLKSHIWPILKKELPKARLCIYGAYLPQQVLEMNNPKEGFEIKGWKEDLNIAFKHSKLLLAPIEFGAGIKGKLADAMINGTPSVTTVIGAEGMAGNLPWSGAICSGWESFAQNALDLYQNQKKYHQAQARGISIIKTHFHKPTLHKRLKECLSRLEQNLQQFRIQNLTGKMLQQQGLSASKYMGKWIEEKNRDQH